MTLNNQPKYTRIEVLIEHSTSKGGYPSVPSISKYFYNNCDLLITGDYLIITVFDEVDGEITSVAKIYQLGEIHSYKTTLKNNNNKQIL